MLKTIIRLLTIVVLLAPRASGTLITVDADGFADVAMLNFTSLGVTLETNYFGTAGPVFAHDPTMCASLAFTFPFDPSTGDMVFAHAITTTKALFNFDRRLKATFDQPTNFVSIDMIADDSQDFGILSAFDTSDTFIGATASSVILQNTFETVSFTSSTYNIAYVIIRANGTESVGLDNLQFVLPPNPTTSPTSSPTTSPTQSPTTSPTSSPTTSPTSSPTLSPTSSPTASPSLSPTLTPTSSPTAFCAQTDHRIVYKCLKSIYQRSSAYWKRRHRPRALLRGF